MMDYNITSQELQFPTTEKLNNAVESLLKHCKNKSKFKAAPFIVGVGGNDQADYTGKSIKRSKYNQKIFQGSIFKNTAAAGSVFQSCTFDNCTIANANFQECLFPGVKVLNQPEDHAITNSNFNRSLFNENFVIKNVEFHHSVFQKSAFINGDITGTRFYSSTLEDTLFSHVNMSQVRFSDLNIDYAEFHNVKMDDVVLPFSQICFTYGILSYLMKTTDSVYITSTASPEGRMGKEEFIALLDTLECYYAGTYDFFPLANIYLAQKKFGLAQGAILSGILSASNEGNFRHIKYFSKLINKYEVFGYHDRQRIYDYINSHISFPDLTEGDLYNYLSYKYEIESFLLNNNKNGIATAEITIFTTVNHTETVKLGVLLTTLEKIIESQRSEKEEHHIIFRHNSDMELILKIQDIFEALKVMIPAIYSVVLGSLVLEEKIRNRHLQQLELRHKKELKNLELEQSRVDLQLSQILLESRKMELKQKKELQKEQAQEIQRGILRKDITGNKVGISKIHHIIYGNIPSDAPQELIQFSSGR